MSEIPHEERIQELYEMMRAQNEWQYKAFQAALGKRREVTVQMPRRQGREVSDSMVEELIGDLQEGSLMRDTPEARGKERGPRLTPQPNRTKVERVIDWFTERWERGGDLFVFGDSASSFQRAQFVRRGGTKASHIRNRFWLRSIGRRFGLKYEEE